jgi:aminopeptidase N
MSTYLVAILVSEFSMRAAKTVVRPTVDDEEMKNVSTTEIRIWAREDAIEQVNFAVEVTPIMLEFLEDYFQVPFPLPKLDLVALPDFSSGTVIY